MLVKLRKSSRNIRLAHHELTSMQKLLEGITSFGYKIPKDPEKLLYDFYFMTGYLYREWDDKVVDFVFKEALNDCTLNLQKHMLKALKWSLSAEFRHIGRKYRDTIRFLTSITAEVIFTEAELKFIKTYWKEYVVVEDDLGKALVSDRQDKLSKEAGLDRQLYAGTATDSPAALSGRNESFKDSYLAILQAQKKVGLNDLQLAGVFEKMFSEESIWPSAFGGAAWAKIARAFEKLITAKSVENRVVYIDHAYDLQHNTGSVFNKLKGYYKEGNIGWLEKALDWKRDAKDLREFYDKVSGSLKPVVAWVAKNTKDLTMEDLATQSQHASTGDVEEPSMRAEDVVAAFYSAKNFPKLGYYQIDVRKLSLIEIHAFLKKLGMLFKNIEWGDGAAPGASLPSPPNPITYLLLYAEAGKLIMTYTTNPDYNYNSPKAKKLTTPEEFLEIGNGSSSKPESKPSYKKDWFAIDISMLDKPKLQGFLKALGQAKPNIKWSDHTSPGSFIPPVGTSWLLIKPNLLGNGQSELTYFSISSNTSPEAYSAKLKDYMILTPKEFLENDY